MKEEKNPSALICTFTKSNRVFVSKRSIYFYIISKVFDLQTSAWSQNARISKKFAAMQSIYSICSHKGYPLNGFSKSRIIKIVFFMCFILDLTCLSLFFITSERIELESWDWAQKMRLSKLHLDLSLSAFDSSIISSYLRRNLECVFFIERIST